MLSLNSCSLLASLAPLSTLAFFTISKTYLVFTSDVSLRRFAFNSLGSTWLPLLLFLSKSWCIPFSWSLCFKFLLAFVSARNLPHEGVACLAIAQTHRRTSIRISSSLKDEGGFLFVPYHHSKVKEDFSCLHGFRYSCSSLFFLSLFDFLLPLQLAKVSACSSLSWVPRCLLPKVLLALSSLRIGKGLVSSMASTSPKGEGGLYLFLCGLDIARRRGGLILYVLSVHARGETCWTRGHIVLSVSKHLGQSHAFGAHACWEVYYNSVVSSTGCLNT